MKIPKLMTGCPKGCDIERTATDDKKIIKYEGEYRTLWVVFCGECMTGRQEIAFDEKAICQHCGQYFPDEEEEPQSWDD